MQPDYSARTQSLNFQFKSPLENQHLKSVFSFAFKLDNIQSLLRKYF